MEEREYQRSAVDAVKAAIAERPLLVGPTGSGKTHMGATVVQELGLPTLWLAHRRELIAQAAERLRAFGLSVGTILAGQPRFPRCMVQVASVQTLARRDLPYAELVVVDEAHHSVSRGFLSILDQYSKAHRVGLTATPFRLDGRSLGDLYGRIIVAAHADDLVRDGTLIEPRVYAPDGVDLAGVGMRAGDFDRGKLARAVDRPKLVGDIVQTWQKHAAGKRTVVFAVNVEHSQHIIAAFVAAGIPAEHLDGTTHPNARRDSLKRLASGQTLVLSNCSVLTEGWDLPALECAIIARPTASLCLHLQSVGRIMRSCKGKTGAIVLDHAGNFLRHGRVTRRIEYSLHGHIAYKEPSAALGLRTCPQCYRMVLSSRPACPECGTVFPVMERELPQSADGELVELLPSAEQVLRDFATREDLRGILTPAERGVAPVAGPSADAKEAWWNRESVRDESRGIGPNKTAWRFKQEFGHWPERVQLGGGETRFVNPETADESLRIAVLGKFQQIANGKGYKPGFAKARYKEIFGHYPTKAVIEGAAAGANKVEVMA